MSVPLAHHAHVFPQAVNAQGTPDALLAYLDNCDIEGAVCFAPFVHQTKPHGIDPNPWLFEQLKGRDRLQAFGTLDFAAGKLPDQVKRIAGFGFKGIKIHPPAQKLDILSPPAMEAYAAAQELDLLLTFHTGVHHHRMRDYAVVLWDEIAWQFPKLRFTMEHVGGWSFFNEAVAVIVNNTPPPWEPGRCRVFAGLTSIYSPETLPFWYQPAERLIELIRQVGVRQLIFGLDFPYNTVADTLRGIETIKMLGSNDADTALILGGNLKRELENPHS